MDAANLAARWATALALAYAGFQLGRLAATADNLDRAASSVARLGSAFR